MLHQFRLGRCSCVSLVNPSLASKVFLCFGFCIYLFSFSQFLPPVVLTKIHTICLHHAIVIPTLQLTGFKRSVANILVPDITAYLQLSREVHASMTQGCFGSKRTDNIRQVVIILCLIGLLYGLHFIFLFIYILIFGFSE